MFEARSSGILLHVSSLPSPFGIGDLGPEAYRFVDFLAKASQRWWQVLPINPTEPVLANSPYSSFSAFAANPLFISPELLVKEGVLGRADIDDLQRSFGEKADYELAARVKATCFERAFQRYLSRRIKIRSFDAFCAQESSWLDDFALFVVIKRHFQGASWAEWPVPLRDRDPGALREILSLYPQEIEKEKFIQYFFRRQWMALQEYCSLKGVGLIGDIPIYVNYDSVDVWVHPELFKLDRDRRQIVVAGVPPDYFSKDGQRWGNPLYDWGRMRRDGFSWWAQRIRQNLALFDAVRIDHFRGFVQCWEIPVKEKTAVGGVWCDVPGEEFFSVLQEEFLRMPIIAEDLGIITDDVDALKEKFGFPGMCVMMFAFHNEYLKSRDFPANYKPCSVAYTGTHDNNTVRGWFESDRSDQEKENMLEYFSREIGADEIATVMISEVMKSAANTVIIPLQDVLGLGAQARMNLPSTVEGNWLWRMVPGCLSGQVSRRLARLAVQNKR